MDINNYISSGILELYVAGVLSDEENTEISALLQKHPELLKEVLEIESAVVKLTAAASNGKVPLSFHKIKQAISSKIIPLNTTKSKYNWFTYTGWAAAILLAAGLLNQTYKNNALESTLNIVNTQNDILENQIEYSKNSLAEANTLISVLRDDAILKVPLNGQGSFANTYAKVYWDKTSQRIFLDAEGLPEPPKGKVYQVWSLTLNPLTPTSLGTIDNFATDANKIFEINNANASEAFGITLEPEGGSKTPTMEQLYTLGVISTS